MTLSDGTAARTSKQQSESFRPIGPWAGIHELYAHISQARRRQSYALLALMLLGAVAELTTIGAVVPFLSLLAEPASLAKFPVVTSLFGWLGALAINQQLVAATAIFALIVLASGAVRLQLARQLQHFGYALLHELIVESLRRFLAQPYKFHIARNTSSMLAMLDKVEVLVFEVIVPAMQALVAAVLAAAIIAALLYIDLFTALIGAVAFTAVYVLVSVLARQRLEENSKTIAQAYDERMKVAQESLDGIRDVIIDNSHAIYLERFDCVDLRLSRARTSTALIATAPRYLIETFGTIIIAALAMVVSRRDGLVVAIPLLGAIALGAQRLLPLLQQIYSGWSTAAGHRAVLGEIVRLLNLPMPEANQGKVPASPLPLKDRISVDGITFSYPNRRRPALEEVTFDIAKGSSIALIGETGSGKSTLADLLMGLIEPDRGRITIDGVSLTGKNRRRWQRSIAHVPQSIFLADSTIANNIALGRPTEAPDRERIVEAARMAHLHAFVTSLPEGYETFVGERGIRLSGGQRQRLGIARAIYKGAPVLVLDEATSALDDETEAAVFESIEELGRQGRTIVIIAHRHSTIAHCDLVIRLHEGRVVEAGTYAAVVGHKRVRAEASPRN